MSEQLQTINVFELNANAEPDLGRRKAILAMQATGLFIAGDNQFEKVNNQLKDMTRGTYNPPTMTYDDVVFQNPVFTSPYVLSRDPAIANTEAEFYRAHRRIEDHLHVAMMNLLKGRYEGDQVAVAADKMRTMRREMDPEHFNAFRHFFAGINGYPGPSGLYSANIPALDLMVHGGENILSEERERMEQNIQNGLYPSGLPMSMMGDFLLYRSRPIDMEHESERTKIIDDLNTFRHVHYGNVKKFVPQAFEGSVDGTGGVRNVASYLRSKIMKGKNND